MRTTKALLLAAGIAAAGLASSMAQTVYSVNVVGFVNLTLPEGYSLICNPLKGTNDNLSTIIPTAPDGATVAQWDPTNQTFLSPATFLFGSWDIDPVIAPGEAFFINLPPGGATLTFVGEVRQGTLTTPISANYSMVGSQVPQAGPITSTLGFVPASDGDTAARWLSASQTYDSPSTWLFGGWDIEPSLEVGEGIVIFSGASGSWTRTFNVNP